jgi:ribosomal protein L7/L12
MSPRGRPADHGRPRRTAWITRVGCLAYLLFLVAIIEVPEIIGQHLGQRYVIVLCLLVAGVVALVKTHQIHRRGQTIAEAMAASRADGRRRVEQERRRRATRQERARHEAALPWLNDKRLSPGELPGVVITPATGAPRHHLGGHDVVLDFPGDRQIQVIGQLRRLTRLSFEEAKDLLDTAPIPVLRVPDMPMAQAAKYILESAGATVSITDPAS